jgi:WD40 repeat protein
LETRQAHRQAQLSLFESRLAEARASRYSSRPGQHFESLKALAEAVRLGRELAIDDPVAIDQMRGHATAALALTDLQVATRWSIPTPSRHSAIHFDSDLAHFTVWDRDALSVRRVTTGQEVSRLPVNPECFQARFSPNDQWICVSSLPGAGDTIQVWDWRRETLVYRVGKPATEYAFDFSPDSRQLAIGHEDGSVSLHDLVTLRQIAEFQVASAPITVAFHPTKPLLAVNCRLAYCTQLWTLDPIRLTRSLQHPSDIFGQCWGPGGRLLAVVEGYDIHLWDVDSPSERPMRILRGHNWVVSELRFHPSGRMLLSNSWREGKTGVWNPRSGEHLLWQDGCPSRFSRDGTRHAFCDVDTAGIWNVSAGEAQIFPPCYASSTVPSSFCGYSPDGQLLASAGDRGVHFWDTTSWQLLLEHAVAGANSVRFQPRAQELLVASRSGLHRYQWTRTESGLELIESGHTALPDSHFPFHLGISADGQTLVADLLRPPDLTPTGKMMLLKRGQTAPKIVMGEADLRYAAVSPDGRWAASGNWRGNSVSLWDAQSGRPVMRLPTQSSSVVAFSPDSALMVFADIEKLRWVETGSWRTVNELQRSALVGSLAFSPDGRVIATTDNESTVQLVETSSGRILASLSANDSPTYVCWLAFHPGGNQLAVCRAKDGLRVWDLRRLREGLQSVGLDWR